MNHDAPDLGFAPGEAVDAARLARRGLLRIGERCMISPLAVFVPADAEGTVRPIELGDGCQVGPFAVIFGGTRIGNGARVEEHVIAGRHGHVEAGTGAEPQPASDRFPRGRTLDPD